MCVLARPNIFVPTPVKLHAGTTPGTAEDAGPPADASARHDVGWYVGQRRPGRVVSRLLTCMFASAWRNPASTDVVSRQPEQRFSGTRAAVHYAVQSTHLCRGHVQFHAHSTDLICNSLARRSLALALVTIGGGRGAIHRSLLRPPDWYVLLQERLMRRLLRTQPPWHYLKGVRDHEPSLAHRGDAGKTSGDLRPAEL